MRVRSRRLSAAGAAAHERDEGSALIMALITVIIGTMIVLPIMNYTMAVLRANKATGGKNVRVEAVKGGLRSVLYDGLKLYQACVESGYSSVAAVRLAVPPGLDIESSCTTTGSAQQNVPSDQRYALATTLVGSNAMIPAPYVAGPGEDDLAGTISPVWCTSMIDAQPAARVPCGRPYPMNGDVDPARWIDDADPVSTKDTIFSPYLPPVAKAFGFAGGFNMPDDDCTVFFPGRYLDDVVITGPKPVYFVSGIYYFEKTVHISGDADIVVGSGAAPGCVDSDAIAVADAVDAPFDAFSNGVGGTWVFGLDGRLVIDNSTPSVADGISLVFNRRLVNPKDTSSSVIMNEVSIMSVNGVRTGPETTSNLDLPQLQVPATQVYVNDKVDPVDPLEHYYQASNLVSPLLPPVPCAAPPTPVVVGCSIIDINLTATTAVKIKVPGYVAVPQGAMSLMVTPGANVGKWISFGGGILTAQLSVPAAAPDYLQLGLLNPVVQKTFRIVTNTTGPGSQVTSVALVKVNETGGHKINSWVVQTTG